MRVSKWGNSLALRLPVSVVEGLKLKEGDDIEIVVADARLFAVARKPGAQQRLARLRKYRGAMPSDFKFSRDEAHGL